MTPAPDHLPDLRKMVTADPDLREVLLAMPGGADDLRPYAREQARLCGLTMNRWHRAAQWLVEHRLAQRGPVFNPDTGAPHGSSWWRTPAGDELAALLEPARADA